MPLVVCRNPLGGYCREAPPHCLTEALDRDVQIRFVEAGVGRIRQILRSSRGPHRQPRRPKAACRRHLKRSLPPLDVQRFGGDDQAGRDGKAGCGQLAQDTGLAAYPFPMGASGLGQIENLSIWYITTPHR